MPSQLPFKRFKFLLNPRGLGDIELNNAPDGWQEDNISFVRSQKYSGITRTFTIPLKFVNTGAFILRREFYQYLLTSNITLSILRLIDGISMYKQIFKGLLDFSKAVDNLTSFTANAIPNDFTKNIDAYDSVPYSISIAGNINSINLELTPITLNEIANLLPTAPPDSNIHSDYFPPIQIVNNQQNSVNFSVQAVSYRQTRTVDWSAETSNFYICRFTGKLLINGSLSLALFGGIGGGHNLRLQILDQTGTVRYSFYDATPPSGISQAQVGVNIAIDVSLGDKLFLYIQQVDSETINTGITILGGELDLAYQTSSPASMCKAIRGSDLFGELLRAMNNNTDSGPNLPVPFQSFLLDSLRQVVYTSSDSIRAAQGSIYRETDSLFPGTYLVIKESVTYNSISYALGEKFSYVNGIETFTGDGVVQKTAGIALGSVYNIGDTLQAGGTYLVEGDAGQSAVYNGITYDVGQSFTFVLGFTTFTGSDDSIYVIQIAEDPQIVISFADFFQDILSEVGGQAAFGVEQVPNPDPMKAITEPTIGRCFIEDLGYVYRAGINAVSLGLCDASTKFEPATDMMANAIKAGYKDEQYDAINGSTEVNSEQNYVVNGLWNPSTTLNLVSPVRADPYGIETVRITQNDSAASRSDNDTFKIWIKSTPEPAIGGSGIFAGFKYWHPLRSEGYMSLTGVDPSYYNYMLSPKQCLLRGGSYLASIFYNMKGYQITIASALKNSSMVYIGLDGKRVAEIDPISISDLPPPFFQPIYATIVPGLDNGVLDMIDSQPYADLNFDIQIPGGMNVRGFINKFSIHVGNDKPTETKLLLTPANNLLTLIRTETD